MHFAFVCVCSFYNVPLQYEFFGVHSNLLTGMVPSQLSSYMACENFIWNCWAPGSACSSPANSAC